MRVCLLYSKCKLSVFEGREQKQTRGCLGHQWSSGLRTLFSLPFPQVKILMGLKPLVLGPPLFPPTQHLTPSHPLFSLTRTSKVMLRERVYSGAILREGTKKKKKEKKEERLRPGYVSPGFLRMPRLLASGGCHLSGTE